MNGWGKRLGSDKQNAGRTTYLQDSLHSTPAYARTRRAILYLAIVRSRVAEVCQYASVGRRLVAYCNRWRETSSQR
jgi:hypothetical protein